jgi:hypothetical protein
MPPLEPQAAGVDRRDGATPWPRQAVRAPGRARPLTGELRP